MSNPPELDVAIATGKTNKVEGPLYYITVEITSSTGIIPEVFVLTRTDDATNDYSFSRVASLLDIQQYGTSPITNLNAHRASSFTLETNSLSFIKELKEGVQATLQDLLDSVEKSEDIQNIEQVTTITIKGGTL